MSDPVTNVEIEDVLSSIRRLVSTEERDIPRRNAGMEGWPPTAEPDDVSDVDTDNGANRLVLTPSLRVDNSQSDPQPEPEQHSDPDHQDDTPREEVSEQSDVWAGEPSETGTADQEGADAHTAEDVIAEDSTEQPTPDAETAASDDALQSRIAELEEVIAKRQENWEPDGTTDEEYSGGRAESLPWVDITAEDIPTFEDADTEEKPDFSPASHGDVWDVEGQSEAPVEEAPDPVASVLLDDEGFANDDDVLDDFAETADSELNLAAAPEDILDEDALRELVAAIVREELQGALGERITRNVRKLVRREIHRAMAIQDLE